jgi:hypothetical protein
MRSATVEVKIHWYQIIAGLRKILRDDLGRFLERFSPDDVDTLEGAAGEIRSALGMPPAFREHAERCCALVCWHCRRGHELVYLPEERFGYYHHELGDSGQLVECQAYKLRQALEKEPV